jgi:hypothetical protein
MHQVVTKAGRLVLLNSLSGFSPTGGLDGLEYHLFDSNTTPTVDSVVGDFTEPPGAWFAAQPAVGWIAAFLALADVGQTNATDLTWVNSSGGPVNLYGFFVVDPVSLALMFAARFDSAPQMVLDGQGIVLVPSFQDSTIYTS